MKVSKSDTHSLFDVDLLYGYEVCIQTMNGGAVILKALQ